MTDIINKLARCEQSRINGAKSKGPTSEEGKAKSSRNALKHGFAATINVVLSIEDPAEFQLHLAGLRASYAPTNYAEETFVEQLANISWRQARIAAIEPALIEIQMGLSNQRICTVHPDCADDNYFHLAHAWLKLSRPAQKEDLNLERDAINFDINSLALLMRYQTSLDRQYNNAMRNFRQYRKDFAPALANVPPATPAPSQNEPKGADPANAPPAKTVQTIKIMPPPKPSDAQTTLPQTPAAAIRSVTPIDKR